MKRITSLLLALAMLSVILTACTPAPAGNDETEKSDDPAVTTGAPETPEETEAPEEPEEEPYAYLFAYFTGNSPNQEKIFYAVSTDGYNYTPLNRGNPILGSKSGTKCVRDPYIFKGHDGAYYMIGTDMMSDLGWSSNRNLISWRSEDLLTWTDETIIKIDGEFPVTKNTTRAWAPQAIWNDERGEYMIYFALCSAGTKGRTIMYYAYSPDLKTLSTEPEVLLAPTNGRDAIDADIIFHDGKYHMFFKDESAGGIYYVTSDRMDGGYDYDECKLVSRPGLAVEGSSTYELFDGSGWLFIADAYGSGFFTMTYAETIEDFDYGIFRELDQDEFAFRNFTPRHGSVIHITKSEYDALVKKYPLMKIK